MALISLVNPVYIGTDKAGRPNSRGILEIYISDGLFTTFATVFSDKTKLVELVNPVTLDPDGTKEIWFDKAVDIRERTVDKALIRDTKGIDPNTSSALSTGANLVVNGSFEIDADTDGKPDSWDIQPYSGSDISITTSVVTNGTRALEFNSATSGSGGGVAESLKFPVTEGKTVLVSWSFYATNADTLNTFIIKFKGIRLKIQNNQSLINRHFFSTT
jgi:hypothetical protein